ncbi:MAG: ABC transporter ATP-binding protein [Myxococcota bacterium]
MALAFAGVERHFGGGPSGRVTVFNGIDLDVPAGQFLALLGPSGCGKSTLLRLVAALDAADGGAVRVDGQAIRNRRHPAADALAFVFQEAHLLPWRTLVRNVELPLELAGVAAAERRARATEMLGRMGLADAHDRYPAQLSGGMRMRGSLARALVTDPKLLLLDEPFAALDELTRQHLDDLVYQLWRERGITVLFVTHSIGEAVFLAERAIMLSRRPATIIADRSLTLPAERTIEVRNTVEYNEQVNQLYHDLLRAEGLE